MGLDSPGLDQSYQTIVTAWASEEVFLEAAKQLMNFIGQY